MWKVTWMKRLSVEIASNYVPPLNPLQVIRQVIVTYDHPQYSVPYS